MTIGQLAHAHRARSAPRGVGSTSPTDEVRCGSNSKLRRFGRMLCALQLTPAHGVDKVFIAKVARERDLELRRLIRIYASADMRWHMGTSIPTDEVRYGGNSKLWRFGRMLCALQLTPAHGVEIVFIAQVVRECSRELWRLIRIHAGATVRCHKGTSKQKQQQ